MLSQDLRGSGRFVHPRNSQSRSHELTIWKCSGINLKSRIYEFKINNNLFNVQVSSDRITQYHEA